MLAAALKKPGRLELEDLDIPGCSSGGLLLRTRACSICSTDVKMANFGHRDLKYPCILGHEIAGEIAEVGSGVDAFQEGDRVQIFPGVVCGRCKPCKRGAENLCERIQIFGFNRDGGFAEYVSIPAESVRGGGVNPIPRGLSFEEAALAEPLACCINGQRLCNIAEGDTVLVFGAGPAGRLHAALARIWGASSVIIAEPLDGRASLARSSGVDLVIDPLCEDLSESVISITEGGGVDVILLASRDVAVDDRLVSLLAPGGRISLFSGLAVDDGRSTLGIDAIVSMHYREILIAGAHGCTSAQNRRAMELISSGSVDVGRLITERVSLGDIGRGMAHAEQREGLKAVVTNL